MVIALPIGTLLNVCVTGALAAVVVRLNGLCPVVVKPKVPVAPPLLLSLVTRRIGALLLVKLHSKLSPAVTAAAGIV